MPGSRYIHVVDAEEYRPITEILDKLSVLEAGVGETIAALKEVLGRILG